MLSDDERIMWWIVWTAIAIPSVIFIVISVWVFIIAVQDYIRIKKGGD